MARRGRTGRHCVRSEISIAAGRRDDMFAIPMRDLLTDPAWRAEDLGLPLPDSPHAVSVAMPLWEHVIGYEEARPEVTSRFQAGYPRFFCGPAIEALFAEAESRFAGTGERSLVFPGAAVAGRCARYLAARGCAARVEPFGTCDLYAVSFPEGFRPTAREYWRYCGENPGTRLAMRALSDDPEAGLAGVRAEGAAAGAAIRSRIAALTGVAPEDVLLFPSGMAAIYAAHRLVLAIAPGKPTVQLDFPYVDALKLQQEFGSGVSFSSRPDDAAVAEIIRSAEAGGIGAVYSEIPSNPLLRSADLVRLAGPLRAAGVPLIVDNTIATVVNVDAMRVADLVTASLTKSFSGVGDVMAGCLTLNPQSPLYGRFRELLADEPADSLWCEDAIALERNSRDFPERVRRMDANAAALTEFLARHPAVDHVWYPKAGDPLDDLLRPGAGRGCLFSLTLRDAARAPAFYDALRVSKGPSLGTNFTLCCPYTLLAHYQELDWAAEQGVPAHLLRVSAGLEDPDDLIARFQEALEAAAAVPAAG